MGEGPHAKACGLKAVKRGEKLSIRKPTTEPPKFSWVLPLT